MNTLKCRASTKFLRVWDFSLRHFPWPFLSTQVAWIRLSIYTWDRYLYHDVYVAILYSHLFYQSFVCKFLLSKGNQRLYLDLRSKLIDFRRCQFLDLEICYVIQTGWVFFKLRWSLTITLATLVKLSGVYLMLILHLVYPKFSCFGTACTMQKIITICFDYVDQSSSEICGYF